MAKRLPGGLKTMTEQEIATILNKSFEELTACYHEVDEINNAYLQTVNEKGSSAGVLDFVNRKKELMKKIDAIGENTMPAKNEWQKQKADWKDADLKSKIEDGLSMLSLQVAKTIESEKKIEALTQESKTSKQQSAADKYKSNQ